jgi:hypothetical protein
MLEFAAQLGITVLVSASLMQSRLARNLASEIGACCPVLSPTRSGQSSSVGMSNHTHVEENLGVAGVDPLTSVEYQRFLAAR